MLSSAMPMTAAGTQLEHNTAELVDKQKSEASALDLAFQSRQNNSIVIAQYLLERVEDFRELSRLREKGWRTSDGDQYFERQRKQADDSNQETMQYFYKMMKSIGQEMHLATGAFTRHSSTNKTTNILDMCSAPGGLLATALELNPGACAVAFSLPVADGGHQVLLPKQDKVVGKFLDITMLASDMGLMEIPEQQEKDEFLPRQLVAEQCFELVICDGQILRTQNRPGWREKREARRLSITQLALGLQHLQPGGTMIVLLHKLEAWGSVHLLYLFRKFSTITVFKPQRIHAKRSSFYMIASDVRSRDPEAVRAIQRWKKEWKSATFDNDEGFGRVLLEERPDPEEVLKEFGPELVQLGKEVWKTQAAALKKASFMRD